MLRRVSLLCVLLQQLCLAATRPGFKHDDQTTYCWKSSQSSFVSNPQESLVTDQGEGSQCPVKIVAQVLTKNIRPREPIKMRWTVSYDFSGQNSMNVNELFSALDTSTNQEYHIIHSNLHACEFGTLCDPFNDGRQALSPTVNQVANFDQTTGTFSFESDEMAFSAEGVYSVMSHIILPGQDPAAERYDYVTYTRLTTDQAGAGAGSGGSSAGVIIGVVVGVLVVVAAIGIILVVRKRQSRGREEQHLATTPHFDEDVYSDNTWKEYAGRDTSTTAHGQVERKSKLPSAPEDSPLRSLYGVGGGQGHAYFPPDHTDAQELQEIRSPAQQSPVSSAEEIEI